MEEKNWNHPSDQVLPTSQILQADGYALSASQVHLYLLVLGWFNHKTTPTHSCTWNSHVPGIRHDIHSKGKRKEFFVLVVVSWLVGFFVAFFWVSTVMCRFLQCAFGKNLRSWLLTTGLQAHLSPYIPPAWESHKSLMLRKVTYPQEAEEGKGRSEGSLVLK